MEKQILSILLSVTMMVTSFSVAVFATDTVTEDVDVDIVYGVMEKIDAIGEVTIHAGHRIKEARSAYDELPDSYQELVENFNILTDAESTISDLYAQAADTDYRAVYDTTGQYIVELGTPGVGSVGGEWMVICLTRSGRECPDGYYENVVTYVSEEINDKEQLHRAKSTDNSRVILALTSAGYDVTNVTGHNLLRGLSDMSYLKRQGINGPIWALIALDCYGYEIPQNDNEETQATREEIISCILEKQLSDNGWSIYGNVADPDMTGMAIQALAPYYDTDPAVAEAVDNALDCLSDIQYENGGFGSIDGSCSESCAQVVVALTALGIDPETDERFIKNGISVVDALCMFAVEGGGFEHIPYGGLNGMATEQGQYALTSYIRFLEGETTLYDMTDVTVYTEEDESVDQDIPTEEDAFVGEDIPIEEEVPVEEGVEEFEDDNADASLEDSNLSGDLPKAENDNVPKEPSKDETEENKPQNTQTSLFTQNTFLDIKVDDWHYESVKYVYENNLMQGTNSGFEPDSKMTRAMLVTVLYRMANPKNTIAVHPFSDVYDGQWYTDAVIWASQNNIVSGVSETKFAPDENVTREQMALIIYRYAKMQGVDVTDSSNLEGFTDVSDVSDWALDAVRWANSVSLVNGTSETALSPKDTATRAQVATILMRFCETLTEGKGKN